VFRLGADVKRSFRELISLLLGGISGFLLLHGTYPTLILTKAIGPKGILPLLLLLITTFLTLFLLIKAYQYLQAIWDWKAEGKSIQFLRKEAIIRFGFLWIICLLLYCPLLSSYGEGEDSYLKCTSRQHSFQGKEYEIQVCEGISYDNQSSGIRLSVFDDAKTLVWARNFIHEWSTDSEREFRIVYAENHIEYLEYGEQKEKINFPISAWEKIRAKSPLLSTGQFEQYLASRWGSL
jgi:hypothetical protein